MADSQHLSAEFFATFSAWALVPKLRTLLWPPPSEAYARLAEAA